MVVLCVVFFCVSVSGFAFFYSQNHYFGALETVSRIDTSESVYIGGMAIGISVKSDGVMVQELIEIQTAYGLAMPKSNLQEGDIIVEINGQKIFNADDITVLLENYSKNDKALSVRVLRDTKEKLISAYPMLEEYTDNYKLGIKTRDYAEGIGTVTYIKTNGEFASLGHPINSNGGKRIIPCNGGNIFDCRISGFSKGKKGNPGELRGTFANQSSPMGKVDKNSRFGVYGKFTLMPPPTEKVTIAPRSQVKTGKAYIYTTIGDRPEKFEIHINKSLPQSMASEKGIVFSVTDKALLNATGGILQGMSGSPIIQDNRLVGAVTHVFLNDPTKGYGVYMDWMFE